MNKARFNSIPVANFARATTPSVHVYMDASGSGLCVLEPQRREFIRHQYPPHELEAIQSGSYDNSINVREFQSAVLAALHWGSYWKETAHGCTKHVCFHIDNTSAVVWASKRLSRHPTVQLYNRLLSLTEFEHQLVFTAEHLPGKLNTMADAGSRAWTESHPLWETWTNLSSSWQQVEVRPPFDNLSNVWERLCSVQPSQGLQ